MNLKALILLSIAILSGCNSSDTPTKEDNFIIKMNEDISHTINLYEYFDQPMKGLSFDLSLQNLVTPEFNIQENKIELTPFADANGELVLSVNGEDANGTLRRFNYNIEIEPVADAPRFTNNNVKIEYNSSSRINTGIALFDVDTDINNVHINIIENDDDVNLIIEDNKVYLEPSILGLQKNITYKIEFNDENNIFYKDLSFDIEYITGQVPLTEESLLSITVIEDVNYIGKIEPQIIYQGQTFEIEYDTSELLGSLIIKENYEYEYIPVLNYNGVDKFKVTIKNNDGDIVTKEVRITVISDIDELFVSDVSHMMAEDTVANIQLTIVDPENNRDYLFSVVSGLNNGQMSFNRDYITYTPNLDFYGQENVIINLLDQANNRSVNFNVDINVISSLDPLAIEDKTITILRGHDYTEVFSFYDAEVGEYSFAISDAVEGETYINQDGTYRYESLQAGTLSQDEFIIYVLDAENRRTDNVTVTVDILDNASPNQTFEVNEDEITNQILVAGVLEGQESDYTVSILTNPTNGTVTLNSNNTFNYKGLLNFNGIDTFWFSVLDRTTGLTYNIGYTATVNPVIDNLDESKVNKSLSIIEDVELIYDVSKLDLDKTGTTSYQIETSALNGIVSIDASTGELRYLPDNNYNGEDNFSVRVNKSDSNESILIEFSIRILAGEDPLYLTSPIQIKMYENSKYTLNIRDLVINEDPEEFIFIGDNLIEGTLWEINTGGTPVFNMTLDALTGVLTVVDNALLSQGDIRNYTFYIREIDSGTLRDFNINIEIIDDMHIIANTINLEDNLAELTSKDNLLMCPGEYTIASSNFQLPSGMGLYGTSNILAENDNNLDIFHKCATQEGVASVVISELGSLVLSNNNKIDGIEINVKSNNSNPIKIDSNANGVIIENSIFKSEISPITESESYIYGSTNIKNIEIKNNQFTGFVSNNLDSRNAIYLEGANDNIVINNNTFSDIENGIEINTLSQSTSGIDAVIELNSNEFGGVNNPIKLNEINLNQDQIDVSINQNIINNALNSINVGSTNKETNGKVFITMLGNLISNSKNGININEFGASLKNTDISVTANEIEVNEEFGVKITDQLLTTNSFTELFKKVLINDNDIQINNNTISEKNSGIIINVDYYDLLSNSKDLGIDVNMSSNSNLDVIIENNTIGNSSSGFRFNKYGIGIMKDTYNYNISGSENYVMDLTIKGNNVYGRNDLAIDGGLNNNNNHNINLNLESNILKSLYPVSSMVLKENYTSLCVYFDDNTIDVIEMYNDDLNSNLVIADINNEEDLAIFNHNTIGNALLSNVSYQQIQKCH